MNKIETEILKQQAYLHWKNRNFEKAVEIILKLEKNPKMKKDFNFNLIFSSCLSDFKLYSLAVRFLTRATESKPSSELASNFLFVNLIDCKAYNLAMNELTRFLSRYPAKKNYRTTLKELLLDLNSGNATNWENDILKFSQKNRIQIGRYYPKLRRSNYNKKEL